MAPNLATREGEASRRGLDSRRGPNAKNVGISQVATAFPELALPKVDDTDPERAKKYAAAFEKLCPRVLGVNVLKIDATDDALQKVLKARLNCGVMQLAKYMELIRKGTWTPELFECLTDMQATASDLWAGRPKELLPWLEELVIVAKEVERYHYIRVLNGTDPIQRFHGAARHRLGIEAALLKAKKTA